MKASIFGKLVIALSYLLGVDASGQFINSQSASDCGIFLIGGSYHKLIQPDCDPKDLYAYDLKGSPVARRIVYSGPFDHPKISPSCACIAFLLSGQTPNTSVLRIMTREGQELLLLPGVLWFDWGSNAKKEDLIAYIAGVRSDAESLETPPRGEVWILNLNTGQRWRIHPNAYLVTWAGFDSSIYISESPGEGETTRITRYDVETMQLEETHYLGSDFSKGGAYYYLSDYDISSFRLFERSSNTEITHRYAELYTFLKHGLLSPAGWISDSMLVLQSEAATAQNARPTQRIIDFKNNQLWEVEPEIIGLTEPDQRSLVRLTRDGVTINNFDNIAEVSIPRQSRGLYCVSRSKRLCGVANAAPSFGAA